MRKQALLKKQKAKHNLDLAKEYKLIERNKYFSDGFTNLLHYGTIASGIYWTTKALSRFAGEETNASLIVEVQQALEVSASNGLIVVVSLLFGIAGIIGYTVTRVLSKKRIKRLAERVVELESEIDTERTSSGLSEDGEHYRGD